MTSLLWFYFILAVFSSRNKGEMNISIDWLWWRYISKCLVHFFFSFIIIIYMLEWRSWILDENNYYNLANSDNKFSVLFPSNKYISNFKQKNIYESFGQFLIISIINIWNSIECFTFIINTQKHTWNAEILQSFDCSLEWGINQYDRQRNAIGPSSTAI